MTLGEIGDDHLKAIGQVTVHFAFLEFTVAELIWGLLGIQQKAAQAVTAGLSFNRSVALASSLAKQRIPDPATLGRLDGLLSKALAAENERNTIVHSTWFVLDEGAHVSQLKFRADKAKGRIVHFATVSADEIGSIASRIADAAAGLQDFAAQSGYTKGIIDADP